MPRLEASVDAEMVDTTMHEHFQPPFHGSPLSRCASWIGAVWLLNLIFTPLLVWPGFRGTNSEMRTCLAVGFAVVHLAASWLLAAAMKREHSDPMTLRFIGLAGIGFGIALVIAFMGCSTELGKSIQL